MTDLLELVDGVTVFAPEREKDVVGDGPRVAFLAAIAFEYPNPAALHAVRADAYASGPKTLAMAIAYAGKEDRAARRAGPLRVVYLGPLGEEPAALRIGTTALLDEPAMIGRDDACAICVRQGPHSDQNTSGRHRARIQRTPRNTALLTDLKSTNGTWVRGLRVHAPIELRPGDEVTIALGHRLRIDGHE